MVGTGRESGAPVDHEIGVVYRLRDGKVWRMRSHLSAREALEDAGLVEHAVPRENADAVRAIYDGWGRGDYRAAVDFYDPYVVLIERVAPDLGVCFGENELTEYGRGWLEQWSEVTMEAEELTEAGDSVIVSVRLKGIGKRSAAPTEARFFHVWTFRGGAAIRLETFRQRRDALEAVGLRE